MSKPEKKFLVARTCTRKAGAPHELDSHPLECYRDLPAYVLLGDPGAGKTSAFEMEARASGGKYVRARDFATLELKTEDRDKTLFIDALDEMRAGGGDGKTPLDHIRKHLERLGRPRFRISCREADWLGESDRADLDQVVREGDVVMLHLDPLSDNDVIEILRHKKISDPQKFVGKADEHKLGELLRNPQTLNLLVEATDGKEWPQSRKEIYEMACAQLAKENSREHRQAKSDKSISLDALLDAAGYLSAIHLLSGIAGYALDEEASDVQHFNLSELATQNLPLLATLKTNLFRRDNEEQRIPVHRSVAEFLGARYLSRQIETHGLPFGRVLALITGEDGGIVPDLRGLAAWLSVHSLSGRSELIERDPLAVVLYGDVRSFPVAVKRQILTALKNEAWQNPWFRSTDWASSPFGALGTADMEPIFGEILSSTSRAEADQALLNCVLDAIRYGEPMRNLIGALESIARDDFYSTEIRTNAVRGIMNAALNYGEILSSLAQDIRENLVADSDDEILGVLLSSLYPRFINTSQILDFLYLPKENLPYIFFSFWEYDFLKKTGMNELPFLLDQLVHKHVELKEHLYEPALHRVIGALLVRGVETHGDAITDQRLYDWLGVGLNEDDDPMLETEHANRIAAWFAHRPERYKALIEYGVSLCSEHQEIWHCIYQSEMRLFDSLPPDDIGIWYLEKAATEQESKRAEGYFNEAAALLRRQGGQPYLTYPALEFIESWINAYPSFQPWLEPFISEPLGEWQQNRATKKRERSIEQEKKIRERADFFRLHIEAIRQGSAHPQILYDLARAYGGLLFDSEGKTPDERLNNFLGGDTELICATHEGFRRVLDRNDLPTINEVVELELEGKMHYIRSACLVGMDELYQSSPTEALQLDDAVLSLLAVFGFSQGVGNPPAWIGALVNNRPKLMAEALLDYALPLLRAGKELICGLSLVVHDEAYSEIARIALPRLLEGFPLRARKPQLKNELDPLLKASCHLLSKEDMLAIVAHKMNLESMEAAQRVYWLVCGLLLLPDLYAARLFKYIGKSKTRRECLASFLRVRWERGFSYAGLTENVFAQLIRLLAVDCSPDRPKGVQWVSPAMETAKLVQSFISTLSVNPSEAATSEFEYLLTLSELVPWHTVLCGALHDQRTARRKATFRRLSVEAVSHTLANLQPASAADLAALAFDYLRDIARKIRDGSTDDYEQYWSYGEGNNKLEKSKPENDCRNALLSDLQERLGKLGIDSQRESSRADNKRADILLSYGGANGFNVPIEAKKDDNPDLWRAIHEQLIPKYIRDPGADGYGIYLVFWFGGKGMRPPSDGKKIRSAAELEERLRMTLLPEEGHRIQVIVIDCALP